MSDQARTVGAAPGLKLEDGARVAVIGGGPAGSLFAYFFLETAARAGLKASVDIYDGKDFSCAGPAGCNMCGGIVSESLVQLLNAEGIALPATVVQRGIDAYVLHTDVGSVRIDPPGREKRIAAVHRGGGPRGNTGTVWEGLDGYLLKTAVGRGATVIPARVEGIEWEGGRPCVITKTRSPPYDLLVGATGINGSGLKLLGAALPGFRPPRTTKTFICELPLGRDLVDGCLGSAMHVYLLNLPRLEFAALIPKGEYATLVMLGDEVNKELVTALLNSEAVVRTLPPGWKVPENGCRCYPLINLTGAPQPFADRVVFIGDCGVNRLYKDGIGGAYRAAKAAARTAVFTGVSAADFRRGYHPFCRALEGDNRIGKMIFAAGSLTRGLRGVRMILLRIVAREQARGGRRMLSGVLWDLFTGSAPYRDVLGRMLHPVFAWDCLVNLIRGGRAPERPADRSGGEAFSGELGKCYPPGAEIIRQGEDGETMYVIQAGRVEVIRHEGDREIRLAELGEGDFFGEMAVFDREVRAATVRALDEVRVLSVNRTMFLRQVHEDPALAFRIMQRITRRVRGLNDRIAAMNP